jgi:hypothetical protein
LFVIIINYLYRFIFDQEKTLKLEMMQKVSTAPYKIFSVF